MATNITIAQIRHDVDTADEFYSAEQDFYDEKMPELENLVVTYKKKLYESPYKDYLVEKIGPVAFKNIELSLKSFDAKLIPLMQEENALVTEYAKLIADSICSAWGKRFKESQIQYTDYDTLYGSFREKIFGIF